MTHQFICTPTEPVVRTTAGKVRGFIVDGIRTFHGIPYAQAKRFQMPEPVTPWTGVFDAMSYGCVCPMLERESAQGEVLVPHRYWPKDENCQSLNIWTPGLSGKPRPVIVWLHGGGFSSGSSIEQVAYDGEALSRFGDVVVVSLNHRLNILGYLDLSRYGGQYWNSGNVGNADIVAALEWIRGNIEGFGGDPDNVTLMGQSGGGTKITSLMQTPAADGLFHKGIIMSGIADLLSLPTGIDTQAIGEALLHRLGLTARQAATLETLPYERLAEAYNEVSPAIRRAGGYVGCLPLPGSYFLGDPRDAGFTEHAKTIPCLTGSVLAEFAFGPGVTNKHDLSRAEQLELVERIMGAKTEELTALFEEAHPGRNLTDLLFLDSFTRAPTCAFCEKKAAAGGAPVYNYLFTFEFPINGGKTAWHCSDIPFVFHNTGKVPVCCVPGVTETLEERMCSAFVRFARTGDPNTPGLPHWPACAPGDLATMILDTDCEVRHNFDKALYDAFLPAAPDPFVLNGEAIVLH